MNLFRKRSTIVLASVGAVGAIAAIATAASLALFYDPVSPTTASYAAGNVTLNKVYTSTCDFDNLYPDYSTSGYPGSLGDQSGTACEVKIKYTGSLDAWLALDVSVQTSSGGTTTQDVVACNGGDANLTTPCEPLYNPGAAKNSQGEGLEVFVLGNGGNAAQQSFGIGNDQTISRPGTSGVNTSYNEKATISSAAKCNADGPGGDCPAAGNSNYEETFSVYVYWPIDENGAQNIYQNSSASVTMTEHAVQATDNPLFFCQSIQDSQGTADINYEDADQPQSGWGAGFSSGLGAFPAIGTCPSIDSIHNGTDWTSTTTPPTPPLTTLLPFFHPEN